MAAPLDSTSLPRRLGRYELLRVLASGGMATVYLGRASGIGGFERLVAIKCCHPHLQSDEQLATMFLDEARLAARIHHPNVVSTVDVGEDGALYFVMEYVHGVTMGEAARGVTEADPLPLDVSSRVIVDVLSGLHAAHDLTDANGRPLNLVHRDISPQNIIIGADGVSRIADFGIAKAEARASVTRGGEVKGKFGYMPPEQFLGAAVTRKADVYAAGVVLWEALAGRRLFVGDSDAEVMNQVLAGKVLPPSHARPGIPAHVDAVVMRALATRPEARFATAAELAEQLERALPPASTRRVQLWVQARFADRLAARLALADEATATSRGSFAASVARERPTLMSRLLDGRALIVSRRTLAFAAASVVLTSIAIGVVAGAGRSVRPADPVVHRVVVPATALDAARIPITVRSESAAPPRPRPLKSSRAPAMRPARPAAPPARNEGRRPEYRPTDL